MEHWDRYRRELQGHGKGGRVTQTTIDTEVEALRKYLSRPRHIDQITKRFGWGDRTARRRMVAVGNVWRVTRVTGSGAAFRGQLYVVTDW